MGKYVISLVMCCMFVGSLALYIKALILWLQNRHAEEVIEFPGSTYTYNKVKNVAAMGLIIQLGGIVIYILRRGLLS